ncbi:hypothetical protein [Microbacterium sp. 77mftsu3.1]|uniref:hypothetical protein n=1 Tax=Microbacterium sp. 77mftsu3.1 TaxID=1761802 RepID=UPI000382D03A|nr:hypothetical protein [Microbacterium sp. 77mftsu3.1]SDH50495.1 hypothetical protein SAMN04488590_3469 [Microbacterium sp. 77mftsu3.1]
MTTAPPPYAGPPAPSAPPAPPVPKKGANPVGIIALVAAVVGFIFACIPGALIIGWILLPIAFILGLVGVFLAGKTKWQAITAIIVSVVGTIVGILVFVVGVSTAIDDAFGGTDTTVGSSTTEETTDEAAPAAEEEPAEEPAAEVGTRENPAPLGAPIKSNDWTVVVNSVDLDATQEVAAENEFNEAADDGSVYITVNVTATYTGTDKEGQYPAMIGIDYVTAAGVTVDPYAKLVVGPSQLDSLNVLYEGASATGNQTMQVPLPVDGVIAIRPGMVADKVFVAVK